jgi:hypothetical protein
MKLNIRKAKKETVATYIFGASVLILIFSFGYYIYLPISKIVRAEQILPIKSLFPLNEIFRPIWGFSFSAILLYISKKLKIDTSSVAILYERLGPGTLLLILLFSVWTFPLIFSFLIRLF